MLKALYIVRGESPQPPPMCSIHQDDLTAAILCPNAHHTPAHWWRGDSVMKPISVRGWLSGHDGQRTMGKFGQDARVTPLLFFEGHPGIFNDHRESGSCFNLSSEGREIDPKHVKSYTKNTIFPQFSWMNKLVKNQFMEMIQTSHSSALYYLYKFSPAL